jgi:hypothetical protein
MSQNYWTEIESGYGYGHEEYKGFYFTVNDFNGKYYFDLWGNKEDSLFISKVIFLSKAEALEAAHKKIEEKIKEEAEEEQEKLLFSNQISKIASLIDKIKFEL